MHKKEFFPLYCVHISRFHSAVTSNPKSFFPAATLDPRPRLWTRDRDIGPTTATLDPRPRLWTRDRDFGPATISQTPFTWYKTAVLESKSQNCWPTTTHVASVCTPCCMLLNVVACRCAKFETGHTFQPTTPNISFAP